ncbi:MAG: hypothetical protein GDA46_01530 [Bdellovibrionales bacterium]|nr:hypothetical protein [Bdellovibrionales bacterium]
MIVNYFPPSLLLKNKEQKLLEKYLKDFQKSSLSEFSFKKALTAKKIFQKIKNQNHSNLFIFVFGGMSGSSYLSEMFYQDTKKPYKISEINDKLIHLLLKQPKEKLKKSHFIFISKSGQTSEILFYLNTLKHIYSKQKISFKNKITILTRDLKSPLRDFAKSKQVELILLKDNLPGRFSAFSLSGFLQFYFQGFDPLKFSSHWPLLSNPLLDFIFSQKNKKEHWLCSCDIYMERFGNWLEMIWSESLLKKQKKNSPPLLKHVSLYNLRHAYIEELITKKKDICVLLFYFNKELKSSKFHFKDQKISNDFLSFKNQARDGIEKTLKANKIPFLISKLDFNESSLLELIFYSYQILFVLGKSFKLNIFVNPYVDSLKKE